MTKNLEQEAHDNLSASVNERSPCGLYIMEDIKIYQCHMIKGNDFTNPVEKHPMNIYQGVVFTTQI